MQSRIKLRNNLEHLKVFKHLSTCLKFHLASTPINSQLHARIGKVVPENLPKSLPLTTLSFELLDIFEYPNAVVGKATPENPLKALSAWVLGLGSWVLGLGSWVLGLGSWVLGLGSWVLGL
ncbi:MAG: hypothetical protein LBJ78_01935, partial [Puniceicoccales bacterium]|nr:hypothetical protein [Puniceicoccales bacterium]